MVAFNVVTDSFSIREQLDDLIDIQTPADAPLHALLDEHSAWDTYFDWNIDEIAAPTAVTTVAENSAQTYAKHPEPSRLTAPVCIVDQNVEVSGSRRQVRTAGMDDPYNYFMWLQSIAAIKQMEVNMHFGKAGTAVVTANTARTCEGVIAWIAEASQNQTIVAMDFNVLRATTAATGVKEWAPAFKDFAGTMTRLAFHDDILAPAWRQGMNVGGSMVICGAAIKRVISEFANIYAGSNSTHRTFQTAESRRKIDTIDWFASDFGEIGISLDRYMDTATKDFYGLVAASGTERNQSLLLFEPDKFTRMTLRGLSHIPMAKVADGTRGIVVYEAGIKCYNPLGGVIAFQITGGA